MPAKKELRLGYCPDGNTYGDIFPFHDTFKLKQDIQKDGIDGCDAVVFWGGTDINPSLYRQAPNPKNYYSGTPDKLSRRDEFELRAMTYCKANGIPMIGICRGAQLMCAFEGGSLLQDVTGHNMGPHAMTVEVFPGVQRTIMTTSAHHQMLNCRGTKHEMLGWSTQKLSKHYWGEKAEDVTERDEVEPEIVYFPRCKGLAIQGHPEWCQRADMPFAILSNILVRTKLLGENLSHLAKEVEA